MPYTKQELQTLYSLSLDDVDNTLTAAKLPANRESYTDEEIHLSFEVVRSYFEEDLVATYAEAAEMFEQHSDCEQQLEFDYQHEGKELSEERSTNLFGQEVSPNHHESRDLDFSVLLARASDRSTPVKAKEGIEILGIFDLADVEKWSELECDRFLEACNLIKCQGKSYEEVKMYFGLATDATEDPIEQVVKGVEVLQERTSPITDEFLKAAAKEQALRDSEKYFYYYGQTFSNSQELQRYWAHNEERAKAILEGKAQARMIRATSGATAILPSSPNSIDSSKPLENGTSDE